MAVVENCTRVKCASGDCGGGAATAEVDGGARRVGIEVVEVAELTMKI